MKRLIVLILTILLLGLIWAYGKNSQPLHQTEPTYIIQEPEMVYPPEPPNHNYPPCSLKPC